MNDDTMNENASKKRRLPGACDMCKKKKIRCDSGGMPGNRCTNCINAGLECTHVELTKNLGSAKGYVEGLEQRLEKMEAMLKKLLPGVDINEELENGIDCPHDEAVALPRNDDNYMTLASHLENLKLDPTRKRFFGRSSGLYLVEAALHHKHHHMGEASFMEPASGAKRAVIWDPADWQLRVLQYPSPQYTFPADDLMESLVELYFTHVNHLFPLLHRPTFQRSLSEGLHHHDCYFGGVVLLVCALGSRYSNDPRAYSEGIDTPSSSGWHMYIQVPVVRTNLQLSAKPTLYEVQCYALAVLYIKATAVSQATWLQIGFGLRMAQDVGAHRRRVLEHPTVVDELWKRAFYMLLVHERTIGSFTGRPSIIQEEDYDLDFPMDCDDEYWDLPDPDQSFKQPAGKPSAISYFIHYLKLLDILSYANRVIYPLRKTAGLYKRPRVQSEQQIIAELDSALNQWLDSVPEHLRWNPKRKAGIFFEQSALLYLNYHNLQIFIHRPFIPMPRNPTSVSFPSLTICTAAARACSHIAMAMVAQNVVLPYPSPLVSLFSASIILLLSTWTGRRSGAGSVADEMSGVNACQAAMKMCETRWPASGRFWDMISDMAAVGERMPKNNNKRPRSTENSGGAQQASQTPMSTEHTSTDRPIAGTRRVFNKASQDHPSPEQSTQSSPDSSGTGSDLLIAYMSSGNASSASSDSPVQIPTPLNAPMSYYALDPSLLDKSIGNVNTIPDICSPMPLGSDFTAFNNDTADAVCLPTSGVNQAELDAFIASLPAMDSLSMSMWSTTPQGFEENDWSTYLSSLEGAFGQNDSDLNNILNQQTW